MLCKCKTNWRYNKTDYNFNRGVPLLDAVWRDQISKHHLINIIKLIIDPIKYIFLLLLFLRFLWLNHRLILLYLPFLSKLSTLCFSWWNNNRIHWMICFSLLVCFALLMLFTQLDENESYLEWTVTLYTGQINLMRYQYSFFDMQGMLWWGC